MSNFIIPNSIRSYHHEAIIARADIGIIVTYINGIITYVNLFALKEFGYTAKELIGKKIELLITKLSYCIQAENPIKIT